MKKKFEDPLDLNEEYLSKLVKTYSSMKPSESAKIILNHKMSIVLKLLDLFKQKDAGKILAQMILINKEKTVSIVEHYTEFQSNYTKELMRKEISSKDLNKD